MFVNKPVVRSLMFIPIICNWGRPQDHRKLGYRSVQPGSVITKKCKIWRFLWVQEYIRSFNEIFAIVDLWDRNTHLSGDRESEVKFLDSCLVWTSTTLHTPNKNRKKFLSTVTDTVWDEVSRFFSWSTLMIQMLILVFSWVKTHIRRIFPIQLTF